MTSSMHPPVVQLRLHIPSDGAAGVEWMRKEGADHPDFSAPSRTSAFHGETLLASVVLPLLPGDSLPFKGFGGVSGLECAISQLRMQVPGCVTALVATTRSLGCVGEPAIPVPRPFGSAPPRLCRRTGKASCSHNHEQLFTRTQRAVGRCRARFARARRRATTVRRFQPHGDKKNRGWRGIPASMCNNARRATWWKHRAARRDRGGSSGGRDCARRERSNCVGYCQ